MEDETTCWCGLPVEPNPTYLDDPTFRDSRQRPYAPWLHLDQDADDDHEAIARPPGATAVLPVM